MFHIEERIQFEIERINVVLSYCINQIANKIFLKIHSYLVNQTYGMIIAAPSIPGGTYENGYWFLSPEVFAVVKAFHCPRPSTEF